MSGFLKLAVIGHPVAQSLSPLIHNSWLKQCGLSGSYEAIDIEPKDLAARVKELVGEGYRGLNVTIPHKQAAMALCASLDEAARKIGAVNTMIFGQEGTARGLNTDAFGLMENLRAMLPSFSVVGKRVLVLGAGGAARAAVCALREAGAGQILVANRTPTRAEELARQFPNTKAVPWEEREEALSGCGLLINTTSLGMTGQGALAVDLTALPREAPVYDIVYKPLMTDLLRQAQERGHPIVTGIGMLLHQARAAFKVWTGIDPVVTDELEREILRRAV